MFFRTDPCRMDIGIAPDDDGAGLRGKTMRRSVPGLRNVRVGPEENRMAGCGNPAGRSDGGPGQDGTAARAGARRGSELRRVFESGKFGPVSVVRLRDCAAAPDGTGRSFRNDSRIGRGVMMRRTPEKRPKGPCPGISRPVPSVVCGWDYSTVSETRKSSPEAGSVTTMLRSSLVKWK